MKKDPLAECIGFEWDEWNSGKNWDKHQVTPEEAEDTFFHDPFVMTNDQAHSLKEKRYKALGKTGVGRRLVVVFTVRKRHIRVISVRDMNNRENREYSKHEKEDS